MNYFSLNSFIKNHRLILFDVMVLSILESAIFIAQFYFIGQAVNDLLQDSFQGIYYLVGLFILKAIISFIKQKRVVVTYKKIYDQLITRLIGEPLEAGEKIDTLAPKSAMIFTLADFFKTDLIKGFETISKLLFTFISLFFLNKEIFLVCLVFALIVFLLYRIQKNKTVKLSHDFVEEFRKEPTILQKRNADSLYTHHQKLENLENQLGSISGNNFAILEILSFGLVIFSIITLVEVEGQNALGTFFTMLYYVLIFSEAMFLLPSIYQKYLRVQEMSLQLK